MLAEKKYDEFHQNRLIQRSESKSDIDEAIMKLKDKE